ncbi:MAG: EcsC family protein [Thermosynechococcaceae cyanobacterium MS004]|nr:EcsC family protein [Thermosynechococcaceae cyanobacterium MS004]
MSQPNPIGQALEGAFKSLQSTVESVNHAVDSLIPAVQQYVEQGTEGLGHAATVIAENPLLKATARLPGLRWMAAALGQVNVLDIQKKTEDLRQQYPQETTDELVQRVIQSATVTAGGIGLAANFLPPLAVALFAVDIAAVATLQAEMLYRIAALYGFEANEPARRGEVLAIYALSVGGTGVSKTILSFVEAIPVLGAVIGASSNAALLYGLGQVANLYYAAKRNRQMVP